MGHTSMSAVLLSTVAVLLVLSGYGTANGRKERRYYPIHLPHQPGLYGPGIGYSRCGMFRCKYGSCFADGILGDTCHCNTGWTGHACDVQTGAVLMSCQSCDHGVCSTGLSDKQCNCFSGWTGTECDIPSTTDEPTTTTTTTTTPRPTTTLSPTQATILECKHTGVLAVVAYQRAVTNSHATVCSATGLHDSHEALILEECNVRPDPLTWKPGRNVLAACNGSGSVPAYSPIAVFDDKNFSPNSSLSGVFLSCTSTGFKFVVQQCGQTPEVMELSTGGTNLSDPSRYYTVS